MSVVLTKHRTDLDMSESQDATKSTSTLVNGRPATMYIRTGIGGRGNYHKTSVVDELTITTSARDRQIYDQRSYLPRTLHSIFTSGIGGVGNTHGLREAAALDTQEEMDRSRFRESRVPSSRFVGIGGSGNILPKRRLSPSSTETTSPASLSQQYSGQALPVGVAEVLRRKLASAFSRKDSELRKGSESSWRNSSESC
ncbi:hypothetical protein MMC06_006914 [Schaereria dolodes]|nr:hypothetical protein [Schaereria dolodes]